MSKLFYLLTKLRHDANSIARAHRLKFSFIEVFAMFVLINYHNKQTGGKEATHIS